LGGACCFGVGIRSESKLYDWFLLWNALAALQKTSWTTEKIANKIMTM
jgi:hypothetical protein